MPRRTKLRAQQVIEIRRLLALCYLQKDLAVRFGVSKTQMSMIANHHTWKGLDAMLAEREK
jgi:hypothetical protein